MTTYLTRQRRSESRSADTGARFWRRLGNVVQNQSFWWTIGIVAGLVLMAVFLSTSTRLD